MAPLFLNQKDHLGKGRYVIIYRLGLYEYDLLPKKLTKYT